MQLVEGHMKTFLEFVLEDAIKFEMITNPRSLKVDLESSSLSFELSNLENEIWLKITISLNPLFPLSARTVDIQNISGNTKIKENGLLEIINMIRNISTLRTSRCKYMQSDFFLPLL